MDPFFYTYSSVMIFFFFLTYRVQCDTHVFVVVNIPTEPPIM